MYTSLEVKNSRAATQKAKAGRLQVEGQPSQWSVRPCQDKILKRVGDVFQSTCVMSLGSIPVSQMTPGQFHLKGDPYFMDALTGFLRD